jgi:hypothetical protein
MVPPEVDRQRSEAPPDYPDVMKQYYRLSSPIYVPLIPVLPESAWPASPVQDPHLHLDIRGLALILAFRVMQGFI